MARLFSRRKMPHKTQSSRKVWRIGFYCMWKDKGLDGDGSCIAFMIVVCMIIDNYLFVKNYALFKSIKFKMVIILWLFAGAVSAFTGSGMASHLCFRPWRSIETNPETDRHRRFLDLSRGLFLVWTIIIQQLYWPFSKECLRAGSSCPSSRTKKGKNVNNLKSYFGAFWKKILMRPRTGRR